MHLLDICLVSSLLPSVSTLATFALIVYLCKWQGPKCFHPSKPWVMSWSCSFCYNFRSHKMITNVMNCSNISYLIKFPHFPYPTWHFHDKYSPVVTHLSLQNSSIVFWWVFHCTLRKDSLCWGRHHDPHIDQSSSCYLKFFYLIYSSQNVFCLL